MLERRRLFLITLAAISSPVFSAFLPAFGPSRRKSLPDPPTPGDPKQRNWPVPRIPGTRSKPLCIIVSYPSARARKGFIN